MQEDTGTNDVLNVLWALNSLNDECWTAWRNPIAGSVLDKLQVPLSGLLDGVVGHLLEQMKAAPGVCHLQSMVVCLIRAVVRANVTVKEPVQKNTRLYRVHATY